MQEVETRALEFLAKFNNHYYRGAKIPSKWLMYILKGSDTVIQGDVFLNC